MKKILLATAAFLGVAGSAGASVIPSLTSVTASPTTPIEWLWSYQGTLSGDAGLTNGSKLVIFDFKGYVPGSIFSPYANVIATTQDVTTGLLTVPGFVDDPTLPNLVFTYNGPDFDSAHGPFPSIDFNGLSAKSIYGGMQAGVFAALTVKNNPDGTPGGTGTAIFDTGSITVPFASGVPESATWALMIMGFGGVGGMLRRRKATAAVV